MHTGHAFNKMRNCLNKKFKLAIYINQKNKIRKAIKKIATKNLCLIPKFKEAHPDCSRSSSRFSDQYNKIIIEACGGSGNNDIEKEDKIIRNIAKTVTINKN